MQIYRTPFMLRHCTSLLIHIGAVVLGPYFSHIALCDDGWVAVHQWCPAPYVMAIIWSIICMLLLNVQVRCKQCCSRVEGVLHPRRPPILCMVHKITPSGRKGQRDHYPSAGVFSGTLNAFFR